MSTRCAQEAWHSRRLINNCWVITSHQCVRSAFHTSNPHVSQPVLRELRPPSPRLPCQIWTQVPPARDGPHPSAVVIHWSTLSQKRDGDVCRLLLGVALSFSTLHSILSVFQAFPISGSLRVAAGQEEVAIHQGGSCSFQVSCSCPFTCFMAPFTSSLLLVLSTQKSSELVPTGILRSPRGSRGT